MTILFQINVYASPWSSNASLDAISFINEALNNNHNIKRVFFFFDGVYNGLASQSPASDEWNLLEEWQHIADRGINLFLCIAAAANRGILNAEEAKRYSQPVVNAAPFFELTGLGQWASGFHDVDRIVSFK